MLRLWKLYSYPRVLRKNGRRGELELDALDIATDYRKEMKEIRIPHNGYIVKPGEIYIGKVMGGTLQPDKKPCVAPALLCFGVQIQIIDTTTFSMSVVRPLRIYDEMEVFYYPKAKTEIPHEHREPEQGESTGSTSDATTGGT